MMSRVEGEWRQFAGIASDRDQLYFAHAQCLMKKSVPGGRGSPSDTAEKNCASISTEEEGQSCGRVEKERADKLGASREGEIAVAKWRKEKTKATYEAIRTVR